MYLYIVVFYNSTLNYNLVNDEFFYFKKLVHKNIHSTKFAQNSRRFFVLAQICIKSLIT